MIDYILIVLVTFNLCLTIWDLLGAKHRIRAKICDKLETYYMLNERVSLQDVIAIVNGR